MSEANDQVPTTGRGSNKLIEPVGGGAFRDVHWIFLSSFSIAMLNLVAKLYTPFLNLEMHSFYNTWSSAQSDSPRMKRIQTLPLPIHDKDCFVPIADPLIRTSGAPLSNARAKSISV